MFGSFESWYLLYCSSEFWHVLNFMPLIHTAKVKAQTFGGRGTQRKRDRGRKEEESHIEIDMNLMRKTKAAYLVSERSQPMYVATVQLKFQLMVNIYTFQIVYHILSFCSSRAHTPIYTNTPLAFAWLFLPEQHWLIHWRSTAFYCSLLYANNIFNTSNSQCVPTIIAAVSQAL